MHASAAVASKHSVSMQFFEVDHQLATVHDAEMMRYVIVNVMMYVSARNRDRVLCVHVLQSHHLMNSYVWIDPPDQYLYS